MKSIILRVGLFTCFLLMGVSYHQASAAMTWPSKCASFGQVKPNQNPSFQHINCLLTNAALAANIPPEVVKAVAEQESGWRQFDASGHPMVSADNGIGIMQITTNDESVKQKLGNDIYFNIQTGVDLLASKYKQTDLPKIKGAGPEVIENWYFPVMAYNGTKPVNSPVHQSDGSKNPGAYQEKVFTLIEKDSFLMDTKFLGQYPFSKDDFSYTSTDDQNNILFNKLEYTLTDQLHASNYYFKKGDMAIVTQDGARLRSHPTGNTSNIVKYLAKSTPLIIEGNFVYDQNNSSSNQFVWYPVKTADQKFAGYISSANIAKKLIVPLINPVDDNDRSLSGKAPANALVQITVGTKLFSSANADANGYFKALIPDQKAGTQLTVVYKTNLNELSPKVTIKVLDKTAPSAPKVNALTNKSSEISGKTEANAIVTVVIAGKTYSTKANSYGNYKVVIPIQNTGSSLSVRAKDSAGNISAANTVTVVRAAPNMPSVNAVKYYSTTVTGKTEKDAIITVKIGTKTYAAKANAYGDYKVYISKQRAGTKFYVTAKDAKGQISATRSVTVSK